METLFRTVWADRDCVAIAAEVTLIAASVSVATFALVYAVVAWAARRRADGARGIRLARWLLGAVAVLVLGIIAIAVGTGETVHRISVAGSGLVFEGCRGVAPFAEDLAFADVAQVSYRTRRGPGRSASLEDEIVLHPRGAAEARVIPLSNDTATLDHALLLRVVPPVVLDAYRAELGRRGAAVPGWLASR
jgi:hypothetical protein